MLTSFISFDGLTDLCLSLRKRLSISSGSCFFVFSIYTAIHHFRHHHRVISPTIFVLCFLQLIATTFSIIPVLLNYSRFFVFSFFFSILQSVLAVVFNNYFIDAVGKLKAIEYKATQTYSEYKLPDLLPEY